MFGRAVGIAAICVLAIGMTACGDDGNGDEGAATATTASSIDTPAPLEEGGDFVFCTDVPYPPAEFQEGSEFKGYEVEMAEEIARRLGTEAVFQKTGFDGIIGALQAGKCDAIVSSMNVTDEREEQVDFVEYMNIGQTVAVPPEDEGTIESLDDLAGKTVAVQVGTTLKQAIDEANEDLDEPITVRSFPDAGAAASALQTGRVDAFFADSPVVADYVNKNPDAFAFGGTQIDELPAGIALRTDDDELEQAVQEAVDQMYEDGTMESIFAEWKVDQFLLEDQAASADAEGEGADTDTDTTEETGTDTMSEDEAGSDA